MPLVINGLGGGHTHTHTHTHTHRRTNQSNFKKPGVHGQRPRVPGLKTGPIPELVGFMAICRLSVKIQVSQITWLSLSQGLDHCHID